MSKIKVESFPHLDGPIEEFLALPQNVEDTGDEHAQTERASTKALLDPANAYYGNASSLSFLAYRDGKPAGRLTAFHNRLLKDLRSRYGLIGLFACENDAEVARALIHMAAAWLVEQGLQMMRGPMAGDIWHRWRFMTRGFDTHPFPGEPRQPEYYPELFTKCGFAPVRVYSTKLIRDLPGQLVRLEEAAVVNRKRGVSYRSFDASKWDDDMRLLYELCLHSFTNYWAASGTPEKEFIGIYNRWLKRIGPEHILYAVDKGGSVVGLGLALKSPEDVINLKTVAVLPSQYGFGLGRAIAAKIYERAIDTGLKQSQHCLLDPLSPEQRWDGGLGQVTREYALFERAT